MEALNRGIHVFCEKPDAVNVQETEKMKFAAESEVSDSENAGFGDANRNGIFDVEDLAMGLIRFENGACMFLPQQEVELMCTICYIFHNI